MLPIVDTHILKEWLKIFLMTLGAMVGMLLISAIYNNLQDLIEWEAPTAVATEFFAMTSLGFLPIVIPVSLLVSLLFILGHFHKNQELTALRAAGLGIFRITRSLWGAGVALSVLMLALNATLVPYATDRTGQILAEAELAHKKKTGNYTPDRSRGEFIFYSNDAEKRMWLVSNFSRYTGQGTDFNVYIYDKTTGKLAREIVAERGGFNRADGTWKFENGREIIYDSAQSDVPARQPAFAEKVEKFSEEPRLMALVGEDAKNLSIPEIRYILQKIGDADESPRIAEYSVRYNTILASPFICLVVVGIAIPFAVAGVRTNPMVGVSKSIGLFAAYFLLTNIFGALGSRQIIPPVAAAWAPNVILLAYAIRLCRKVN